MILGPGVVVSGAVVVLLLIIHLELPLVIRRNDRMVWVIVDLWHTLDLA